MHLKVNIEMLLLRRWFKVKNNEVYVYLKIKY